MWNTDIDVSDKQTLETLLVAYDYCVFGLRGERLAKHRGLTSATFGRRLREAKDKYIREAVLDIPPSTLDKLYSHLCDKNLADDIRNEIGRENLRHLIIVPSTSIKEELLWYSSPIFSIGLEHLSALSRMELSENLHQEFDTQGRKLSMNSVVSMEEEDSIWLIADKNGRIKYFLKREGGKLDVYPESDTNMKRVAGAAAVRLISLVNEGRMENVGVSYGATLGNMVDNIRKLWPPGEQKIKPKWIPIFGDLLLTPDHPLYPKAFRCMSSTLAANLSLTFRGSDENQLVLPAPAYIPRDFMVDSDNEKERIKMARQFVHSIPAYKEIFGTSEDPNQRESGLVTQLDTVITGIGGGIAGWLGITGEPNYIGPVYNKKESEELSKRAVGDLCGTFVTVEKVNGFPESSAIARVNSRLLGIVPADFRKCAARAKDEGKPGVIIVADGKEKAGTTACAISNRCVSELICDTKLAMELARIKRIR
jgi:hypothetical protein